MNVATLREERYSEADFISSTRHYARSFGILTIALKRGLQQLHFAGKEIVVQTGKLSIFPKFVRVAIRFDFLVKSS